MSDILNKRVIYPNDEGGVSILVPSSECPSLERLIQDVPEGKPHQVIDITEVPDERTYRGAWIYEEN
jgi:hypothetical protein